MMAVFAVCNRRLTNFQVNYIVILQIFLIIKLDRALLHKVRKDTLQKLPYAAVSSNIIIRKEENL